MDYTLALNLTLQAILIWAFVFGIMVFCAPFSTLHLEILFLWLVLFVSSLLAVFAVLFSTLNFFSHSKIELVDAIATELRSGVLGLRISSILIGLRTFLTVLEAMPLENVPWQGKLRQKFHAGYEELDNLPPVYDERALDAIDISQNGIYLTVVSCLWGITIIRVESTAILVLNWALFFIVDDWVIVAEQMRAFKGRVLKRHLIKIGIFNAILILLLLYTLALAFGTAVTLCAMFVLAIFVFIRHLLFIFVLIRWLY